MVAQLIANAKATVVMVSADYDLAEDARKRVDKAIREALDGVGDVRVDVRMDLKFV